MDTLIPANGVHVIVTQYPPGYHVARYDHEGFTNEGRWFPSEDKAHTYADKLRAESPKLPLAIGQLWRARRGPWPPKAAAKPVRILDLLDGWVRYYVNEYMPDEREKEETFRKCYPELVHADDLVVTA